MVISENVGYDVTFSILNATTNKVISRSNIRIEGDPTSSNLRIDPLTAPKVVTSRHPPSNYLKNNEEAPAITEDEPPNSSISLPKHKMHIIDTNDCG